MLLIATTALALVWALIQSLQLPYAAQRTSS